MISFAAPILALFTLAHGVAPAPDAVYDPSNKAASVLIITATERGNGLGSGAVIDRRGLVLTNFHVVDLTAAKSEAEDEGIFVCADGLANTWLMEPRSDSLAERLPGNMPCRRATLIGISLRHDLALLKIDAPLAAQVRLTDEVPGEGDVVYSRANVGDYLGPSLKIGRFIAKTIPEFYRMGDARRNFPPHLVLDLGAMPGASGGPVFDGRSRMCGLIVAVTALPGRADTFAITGNDVIAFTNAHNPFKPSR